MKHSYQVLEDNGGGMFLFFFDENDKVVLGIENIEYAEPGDLDNITLDEASGWESQLNDPAKAYKSITRYEFGWEVVADENGTYPDRMGGAALILFRVSEDEDDAEDEEDVAPSKSQLVNDHPLLRAFVPSAKSPHIDALIDAGLFDLTVDQLASIVKLMQTAYRNGQYSRGAEKIDRDAVWLDGVGALERQSDDTWKLTMPDKGVDISTAAATLGRKGGESTSPAKTDASRLNGKNGGRPRKYSVTIHNRQGAVVAPSGFVGTKSEIEDYLRTWADPENLSLTIIWRDGREYGRKPLDTDKIEWDV